MRMRQRSRFKITKQRLVEPGELFSGGNVIPPLVKPAVDRIPELVEAMARNAEVYFRQMLRDELEARGLEIVEKRP